jgi:hypothetical protein
MVLTTRNVLAIAFSYKISRAASLFRKDLGGFQTYSLIDSTSYNVLFYNSISIGIVLTQHVLNKNKNKNKNKIRMAADFTYPNTYN